MGFDKTYLEKAFLPFEKKLLAQEKLRQFLGVKEVDQPTYNRYITGPIDRFDWQKNAFAVLKAGNPFGEDYRKKFKARTGYDDWEPPPALQGPGSRRPYRAEPGGSDLAALQKLSSQNPPGNASRGTGGGNRQGMDVPTDQVDGSDVWGRNGTYHRAGSTVGLPGRRYSAQVRHRRGRSPSTKFQ